MITLKLYENKRKLLKTDTGGDIVSHILKNVRAGTSDVSTGGRGELSVTFQTSSMECIPEMNTFVEFIVNDHKYYYKRIV